MPLYSGDAEVLKYVSANQNAPQSWHPDEYAMKISTKFTHFSELFKIILDLI